MGAAREKVRVARALADLPRLSTDMRRGALSYSKARALTRIATTANEVSLAEFARCATAAHVERLVRAWRSVDRIDEAADEKRRHASRHLDVWTDEDGMLVVRGRLSPEVGAVVRRALDAATDELYRHAGNTAEATITRRERDAAAGGAAARAAQDSSACASAGQRRADALGLLAETALASGLDRGSAGDRYQVVVHVDAEVLQADAKSGQAALGRWRRNAARQSPMLCRRHHRAVHEEDFSVELRDGSDARFSWPDGRPFPVALPAPRWAGAALAPTSSRLVAAGIAIDADTSTPDWHGERLELDWATMVLRPPAPSMRAGCDVPGETYSEIQSADALLMSRW